MINNLLEILQNFWTKLSMRERILMLVTATAVLSIIIYIALGSMIRNIDAKSSENENYRTAIALINDSQEEYAKNKAMMNAMRERLISADTKVVSKLTNMAGSLGFDVSVTPKDPHKTSDDSGAEEQEIEITIRSVEFSKLLEYLIQIQRLDTPIYMRHINMTRTSSIETDQNSTTQMTATITLISYRLKEENAP